jgi:hypothetical protein
MDKRIERTIQVVAGTALAIGFRFVRRWAAPRADEAAAEK